MASLIVDNLRKSYGNLLAADVGHLEVADGEFVSLLGPSGCGKTTTLHCVAGLVEPDSGRVIIGGRDVTHVPVHKRDLGMVFQNYALFPHLTIFQNVAYGLENRNTERKVMSRLVAEALALVELRGCEDRYPHQLSGGQQQRVALARAIVYRPDVLLLDEPLSNLDAKLRKSMRFELRRLQQQLELTTIFVTHDQQEALSMSDRVVVMNRGRIEQLGTPLEIYERPSTLFVADFMGTSNLIRGKVAAHDMAARTACVVLPGGSRVTITCQEALSEESPVQMTVKPERIRIGEPGATGTSRETPVMEGKVIGGAYLGGAYSYQVRAGEGIVEVVDHSNTSRFGVGDAVWLQFDPLSLLIVGG